jgi:putative ABC transport system permease protein
MSRDFLLLVAISNLIAWPAVHFVMSRWLQNFVYRTDLGVTIFFLAALTGVFIAFFTISFQSIKVALINPVDSLRYE